MNDISRIQNRVGSAALTAQQKYFVQVASDAHHQKLSVVSFEAVERIGDPYRITVQLTYEKALLRADYLGRDATFAMDPGNGDVPCIYAGCITRFSQTKTTLDVHAYEFVIESHAAKLRITESCQTFQQNTGPEIIETVLRKHGFERHQFSFKLRRDYPKHLFCFQYQMNDWAYIHMLMQKEGIFCYWQQGEHGDVLVFGDDPEHCVYQPVLRVPYCEESGLPTDAVAVTRLRMDAKLVPHSILATEYHPLRAWELHQAQMNAAPNDFTTYGESSHFGTGQLDHQGAKREALLRHEAALAQQVIYDGVSNVSTLRPGRVFHIDRAVPDAPDGQMVIEVKHSGARDKAYRNIYKAIPADRFFRLPLAQHTWPKIAGTLSARVTAPKGCEYAYLTDDGRYTVRLSCDAGPWQQGGESVPLRLAKPFAGPAQTGMHFPVLAGTEAVIGFRDGDPDKPYIVAFHHTDLQPDLVNKQGRRYTRNLIRTQSDCELGMENFEGQEGINLSTEHSGKTHLRMGYLPDREKNRRGTGFELSTGDFGALSAALGILISSDSQSGGTREQLEMGSAVQLLELALEQMQMLAAAVEKADACIADIDAMKTSLYETIKGLQQPGVLITSPASVAMVSGKDIQLTARENIAVTTGKSTDVGAVKNVTVAAGEVLSLFAKQLGIKMFAANGKVDIQAQNDALSLSALNDVTIKSVEGKVTVTADKELWFGAGGSYIKVTAEGIEVATAGDILQKCASWEKLAPASMSLGAVFPEGANVELTEKRGSDYSM